MIDAIFTIMAMSVAATVGTAVAAKASPKEVLNISKTEARAMLERSELTAIDVRMPHDWEASDLKVQGAIREDPNDIDSWAGNYPKDKALLLY